jgi:hypothetical protein
MARATMPSTRSVDFALSIFRAPVGSISTTAFQQFPRPFAARHEPRALRPPAYRRHHLPRRRVTESLAPGAVLLGGFAVLAEIEFLEDLATVTALAPVSGTR